jgi:hypothetical protein
MNRCPVFVCIKQFGAIDRTMRKLLLTVFALSAIVAKTFAVRPFITDDAAVTGRRLAQFQTWGLFDKYSNQHWTMIAYGFTEQFEMAIGGVWGYDRFQTEQSKLSFAMPLLEAKYLFRAYEPDKLPGIAMAAGTFLPAGKGAFVPPGKGAYGFLAVTQCFGREENVLLHGNIGVNYLYANKGNQFLSIWGLGTQIKAYKGLHLVGEIVAGDPYVPGTGIAYQAGFRYFISDLVQVDIEMGQGISGQNRVPFWAGFGARFVLAAYEKKKK